MASLNDDANSILEIMPDTPHGSCFSKSDFIHQQFAVDDFVRTRRADTSLEKLEEQLGTYLKSLRLSLNDLINDNYSDFVNMSTNIVGTDKSIAMIRNPIEKSYTDIVEVRNEYATVVDQLRDSLHQLKTIRNMKRNIKTKLDNCLLSQIKTELVTSELESF